MNKDFFIQEHQLRPSEALVQSQKIVHFIPVISAFASSWTNLDELGRKISSMDDWTKSGRSLSVQEVFPVIRTQKHPCTSGRGFVAIAHLTYRGIFLPDYYSLCIILEPKHQFVWQTVTRSTSAPNNPSSKSPIHSPAFSLLMICSV